MERRRVLARIQCLIQRDAGERLAGGERLARPEGFAALQRQAEDKGTGVLRREVQNHLKKHPSVRTFRLGVFGEGDSGVTIAELK